MTPERFCKELDNLIEFVNLLDNADGCYSEEIPCDPSLRRIRRQEIYHLFVNGCLGIDDCLCLYKSGWRMGEPTFLYL